MAMNSTSSADKPTVIVPSSKTDEPDCIDWLRVNYISDHTRQEIQEFYISQYGSIEAAKSAIEEFRQDIQSNRYRERAIGRCPAPDEIMHVVDINKHQIGMWRGDMADSRQYQFAFINSDSCPIPVPLGVHIYGVPRPDGDGTAHEVLSACGAETADVRSEVFVAPEGAVYRVTELGRGCSICGPSNGDSRKKKGYGISGLSLHVTFTGSSSIVFHETPPKGMKGFWMESDPRGAQGKPIAFPMQGFALPGPDCALLSMASE
ncbi:hypothetical protein ARMGADRAFT_986584 [Armillaria gallica]|uniref:Uncharacterized protein n=1 Tax=Armillaria gallica TaxID=47427 RepID=A0A2H3DTU2_ARMGA|nr:hypothetical protein ARMGADRAFT_986584 [Armillaria gallica]